LCCPRYIRARSFVGRSVSANEDGDEKLIGATCDSDVGSGLGDEMLMFTSVDSTGSQVDGVGGPAPAERSEQHVARRRVGLLPGAAVERSEATAAGLGRAGGPTVDDAGNEVRLAGGPRGRQSVRRVIDSTSGLFSLVCYSTILILFM